MHEESDFMPTYLAPAVHSSLQFKLGRAGYTKMAMILYGGTNKACLRALF